MAYRPGEMDQRIELQRVSRTPDGGGGYKEQWLTYATVWARVRPLRGGERARAQQQEATANYLVVIYYRSDVQEADRIVWNGKTLNIRFIADEGPSAMFLPIEAELEQPRRTA